MRVGHARLGFVDRLTLFAGLAGLVIGLFAMLVVDRFASRALLDQVQESNLGVAARLAVGFDDRLDRAIAMLRFAAVDEDLVSMERESATSELRAVLTAEREYDRLTLYDRAGRPIAAVAARSLIDASELPTRRDLVDEVAETGNAVRILEGRVPLVEATAPVESPPGHIIGVLAAEIPLEVIGSVVATFRTGDTGVASILDRQGITLVHPDRARIVRRAQVDIARGLGPGGSAAGRQGRGEAQILVAVSSMTLFPGSVAVEQDVTDAAAPASGARRILVLIVLLSVASTVGVIAIAGRRVLAPIGALTEAVRELGAGSLSARAPTPARADEIGELSEQFNRMAGAMEGMSRAKDEFVANAAHELRTPLSAIIGLAELLVDRAELPPEDLDDLIAALARQSDRARILVERMLDLLRIEGADVAPVVPVDVGDAVRAALTSAPTPEGRIVSVEVEKGLAVLADEVSFDQVLANLLTNAYRYGGETIEIRGARNGSAVVITIEDDGAGVSQRAEEYLFEPFNRGIEQGGVGSGLGLAIVRRLLRSMSGDIRYERRAPTGARFIVELRRAG